MSMIHYQKIFCMARKHPVALTEADNVLFTLLILAIVVPVLCLIKF